MLDSKLQKSMWQICTFSGSVKEVLGESLDLITFNFNECFTIYNWFEHAYYRVDWEIDGHHLGYIPFNLHGNHSLMAHHCMFKEAHTISYIQQANHEWIEGDEEETAYAQATESLRVVPINIIHGPEVLQRFKAAHKPLVKALSSFENMESHGEPIKPILR